MVPPPPGVKRVRPTFSAAPVGLSGPSVVTPSEQAYAKACARKDGTMQSTVALLGFGDVLRPYSSVRPELRAELRQAAL